VLNVAKSSLSALSEIQASSGAAATDCLWCAARYTQAAAEFPEAQSNFQQQIVSLTLVI